MGIRGFRSWVESQFPEAVMEASEQSLSETFDHVLIDVNQLLHPCLRRSRNENQALGLLMKRLDSIMVTATPTQSLVFAMDGPPSAAKLATQRQRRWRLLQKSDWKLSQLSRYSSRLSARSQSAQKRRCEGDIKTLRITSGTDFMRKAKQCLMYWAWQRMQNPNHFLSQVRVYISPSEVPGEGEIKLFDWITRKRPNGTIAIIGGDADLVLGCLVIPPSISHNIFVLLPEVQKRMSVVSLWEMTRTMSKLVPLLQPQDIMRARTDMVLLVIFNGNDYLPKLRGASALNKVFRHYVRLLNKWLREGKSRPFLVDPDTLEFNSEFFMAYMESVKPPGTQHADDTYRDSEQQRITNVGILNNLIDSPFLPKPLRWKEVVTDEDDDLDDDDDDDDDMDIDEDDLDDEDEDDDDDEVYDLEEDEDMESLAGIEESQLDSSIGQTYRRRESEKKIRLTIGKQSEDGDFYSYETTWRGSMKATKNFLAEMAINDTMGDDFLRGGGPDCSTYGWQVLTPADSDVELYLGGLLWNLQTYQDGICSDYGYNYGRRMSPTAEQLFRYFEKAVTEGRVAEKKTLNGNVFRKPISAGVSCLAALPSKVQELVPEPYCWISDELVETMYASCMDKATNEFDMHKFERLCNSEVEKLGPDQGTRWINQTNAKHSENPSREEGFRQATFGTNQWIVLSRVGKPIIPPYAPPQPFSDYLSSLRPSRWISMGTFNAIVVPPTRFAPVKPNGKPTRKHQKAKMHRKVHGTESLLRSKGQNLTIEQVEYWTPYSKKWEKIMSRKKILPLILESSDHADNPSNQNMSRQLSRQSNLDDVEIETRMKDFGLEKADEPGKNLDGQTAIAVLSQLRDIKLLRLEWNSIVPSPSEFASVKPDQFELVQLKIKGTKLHPRIELSRELDREVSRGPKKQLIRQHLAALALSELFEECESEWHQMTSEEAKEHLMKLAESK